MLVEGSGSARRQGDEHAVAAPRPVLERVDQDAANAATSTRLGHE